MKVQPLTRRAREQYRARSARLRRIYQLCGIALLLSGCVNEPTAIPEKGAAQASAVADIETCRASGGSIRDVCMVQAPACVIPFSDGGRRCTDNSQCKGKCILDIDHRPQPDEKVVGRCQVDDDPCGCKIEVVDGKVGGGTCKD